MWEGFAGDRVGEKRVFDRCLLFVGCGCCCCWVYDGRYIVSWKLKSFSEKLESCDFVLPLLVQREEDLLGGSSWKLLKLTSISRFLAYVTEI